MSSSSVPCRAPYAPVQISPNAKKLTIKVGQGDDMDVYLVPVISLCRVSNYFRDHLHDSDRAMRRHGLAFAYDSSEAWEVFVDRLRSGTLNHSNLCLGNSSDEFYPFFITLYSLASRLQAYAFRNTIIDTLFCRILQSTMDDIAELSDGEGFSMEVEVDADPDETQTRLRQRRSNARKRSRIAKSVA